MSSKPSSYGLEQARAQLPLIAAEASAGYSSVITRHGKPVAVVVPVQQWKAEQTQLRRQGGVLGLRGTGRGLWGQSVKRTLSAMRDEWGS